jgi:transcription antitermination protein NusB
MQTNRKKSRKLLFQILYSKIFNKYIEDDFIDSFNSLIYDFDMDQVYIKSNMNMIKEYESFFIHIINKYSKKFKIEQINKIYIIPIYISLSELFYIEEEIPLKVSINEATEIAKIY